MCLCLQVLILCLCQGIFWPLFLMSTIYPKYDNFYAVLLFHWFEIPPWPVGNYFSEHLGKCGGNTDSYCDSAKFYFELCHHCLIKIHPNMYSFTDSRVPQTAIFLDLTHTSGSKIHLNRYGSNLNWNTLSVQTSVAPVWQFKIWKHFYFCDFQVALGKVFKFQTKRKTFTAVTC